MARAKNRLIVFMIGLVLCLELGLHLRLVLVRASARFSIRFRLGLKLVFGQCLVLGLGFRLELWAWIRGMVRVNIWVLVYILE